jgi:hypothetical protein
MDYMLKNERLVFEVAITANATPASKVHASDIPGVAVLRTEGKTAEADAIENLSAQVPTATDSTGVFSILIDDPSVKKFLKASVTPSVGTVAVTKEISSGGRLILEIDSNQDLSSTNLSLLIEVDYQK